MYNFSSVDLNNKQINLLSKGTKYCTSTEGNSLKNFVAFDQFIRTISLKYFFDSVPHGNSTIQDNNLLKSTNGFYPHASLPDHLKALHNEGSEYILNHDYSSSSTNHNPRTLNETNILNSLRKLPKIKFCKSDKSNSIILFNSNDYDNLVFNHFNDSITYEEVSEREFQTAKKNFLLFLNEYSSIISKRDLSTLKRFKDTPCTFRILPKLHKSKVLVDTLQNSDVSNGYLKCVIPQDVTTRPIVNNINYLTEHLSEIIDILLQPLVKQLPSYIKDTQHFIHRLPSVVCKDSILCSFDVISLYTCIPHDFGLIAIEYFLDKYPSLIVNPYTKQFILSSISFILNNCYIKYKYKIYHQRKGTAMGTKFSPSYANLTMGYIEHLLYLKLHALNNNFHIYFHKNFIRFIDDCFIILPQYYITHDQFFKILNSLHADIKFTSNYSLSSIVFLDVNIMIKNMSIITDIHYKPTNNFNYLHFNSFHPRHIKRAIPYTLFNRINYIVNEPCIKYYRKKQIFIQLLSLKYPKKLLFDAYKKSETYKFKKNLQHTNIIPSITHFSLNCNNLYNQTYKPIINSIYNTNLFKNNNFVKTFYLPNNIFTSLLFKQSSFSSKKCNRPRCKTCNIYIEYEKHLYINNILTHNMLNNNVDCSSSLVIYIILCSCNLFYIGRTQNSFNIRINLHRHQSSNISNAILDVNKHICNTNHSFRVSILYKCSSIIELNSVENYFIKYYKPHFNS